ncbi:hypothetical protein C4572_02880 [Candidatus Parcubacteria bacterium]|nr:MAG: hypothetical protein C4572_02880 [Candidatus Parcubacteria bacterium]
MKKLLVILFTVVVILAGTEYLLDLLKYETEIMFQYQPQFGWTHTPDKNFWYGGNSFKINEEGFRDKNHQPEKKAGIKRVGFISSHYLRGTNSDYENIATTIVEREWNNSYPDNQIEVFNLAVSKYNIELANYLISYFEKKYQIDYFIYLFDPQKDPMAVAGASGYVHFAPSFVFDESGNIAEKKDFQPGSFVSPRYKTLKIYQLTRNIYYNFIRQESTDFSEASQEYMESLTPYPDIYFNTTSEETDAVISKIARIIDYTVENHTSKVYYLFVPPQQTQFFGVFKEKGNLDEFLNNVEFSRFVETVQKTPVKEFLDRIIPFVKKAENNEFNHLSLPLKIKDLTINDDRIIVLDREFLEFTNQAESGGFLHNWHRRDAGQRHLASILIGKILPSVIKN